MDDASAATPELRENRRDRNRHRTLLGATLVYGPDLLTVDCTIRDRSDRGVRIELPTVARRAPALDRDRLSPQRRPAP
jgi:hypothetical protein